MKKSDFYFDLPEELIAQTPLERRDASRLLTLDKTTGAVAHHHFYELPQFLRPNDCLVLNDSRVLPARLLGHRQHRRCGRGAAAARPWRRQVGVPDPAGPQDPARHRALVWRRGTHR